MRPKPLLLLFLVVMVIPGIAALKTRYGGELRIRLNEPESLRANASSHDSLILSSLLYDNFFYSLPGHELESHLFKRFQYEPTSMSLQLELHEGLAFSNGRPVLSRHVRNALTGFFKRSLYRAKKLAGRVKNMVVRGDTVLEIFFSSPNPDFASELTAPELVLTGDEETAFSGPFYPGSWEKGKQMTFLANPHFAGGRHPLDRVLVFFQETPGLDIFLAEAGYTSPLYKAFPSGLYENVYISYPGSDTSGQNKRMAFYALCKGLAGLTGFTRLDTLTSAEESPFSLSIKLFTDRRVVSLLRNSKQIIHLTSSLGSLVQPLTDRFKQLAIPLEIRTVSDTELSGYIQQNDVPILIAKKLFRTDMPLAEKLATLLREFSFNRFNEEALGLINQLEEIASLDDENLRITALGTMVEKIVESGTVLPLYQQRFSLMVTKRFESVIIDYYGRIVWSEIRNDNKK